MASYFDTHARDFDSIYDTDKSKLRLLRDRLTRGTVVRRLDFANRVAERDHPGRVLDVGRGSGRFAVALAKGGAQVIGLDFAPDMLAIARRAAEAAGVAERCTFVDADFLTWDVPHEFDLALAIGVFDYVGDAAPLLARLAAVSRGRVIASFPRLLHPLVPLRLARLRAKGCPLYLYRRGQVDALARAHLPSSEVLPFARDYLMVGNP